MHGFTLQLRMMRRRLVGNALVILLLVVTTLFLLLYPGVIENAAEKMVTAGKGILVNGWAYHPKDDQYISVPVELRDGMMESGYVKSYIARSTVQFSALEEIIQKQGEGDTPEARRAFILQKPCYLNGTVTIGIRLDHRHHGGAGFFLHSIKILGNDVQIDIHISVVEIHIDHSERQFASL